MRKITIKDIAKEAGVSIYTVSSALNDTRTVKKETKEKIKEIAKKYNYRPSYMAKAIRTRESKTVALIIHHFSTFSKELLMIRAIEKSLNNHGYCLNIFNTQTTIKKEDEIINIIEDRLIDAVILHGYGFTSKSQKNKIIEGLIEKSIPLFIIERDSTDYKTPFAVVNNYNGGKIAAELLLKSNHKRIGVLSLPMPLEIHEDRINGFQYALKQKKVNIGFSSVMDSVSMNFGLIYNWLENIKKDIIKSRVSSIFCTTDLLAIASIKVLQLNDVAVPGDISIIGFDNHPISQITNPELTTINNDLERLGEIAVENIVSIIKNNRVLRTKSIIEPDLIERGTVRTV